MIFYAQAYAIPLWRSNRDRGFGILRNLNLWITSLRFFTTGDSRNRNSRFRNSFYRSGCLPREYEKFQGNPDSRYHLSIYHAIRNRNERFLDSNHIIQLLSVVFCTDKCHYFLSWKNSGSSRYPPFESPRTLSGYYFSVSAFLWWKTCYWHGKYSWFRKYISHLVFLHSSPKCRFYQYIFQRIPSNGRYPLFGSWLYIADTLVHSQCYTFDGRERYS